MKKINFRKTLFAAVLLFQLNAIAAFGQTVVKGSVKDNTCLLYTSDAADEL